MWDFLLTLREKYFFVKYINILFFLSHLINDALQQASTLNLELCHETNIIEKDLINSFETRREINP